jgi:hypothetical protein
MAEKVTGYFSYCKDVCLNKMFPKQAKRKGSLATALFGGDMIYPMASMTKIFPSDCSMAVTVRKLLSFWKT